MKRTFYRVLAKTPWVLAHACLLSCIVSPLVLWSARVIPSPTVLTESAGGIKIHGTGIPRGIPSQEEMAPPGHFRVELLRVREQKDCEYHREGRLRQVRLEE